MAAVSLTSSTPAANAATGSPAIAPPSAATPPAATPPAATRPVTALTPGTALTVAGGVGGPGTATKLGIKPCGLALGSGGLYLSEGAVVRRLGPVTDQLTAVAGVGTAGISADGSRAAGSQLDNACDLSTDHFGNLVLTETVSNRIRLVATSTGTFYGQAMTKGDVYTVAGDGTRGFSGDGGPATSAELNLPQAVIVDGAGNLVVADTTSNRIRVVAARTGTFYGRAMTKGDIYTVAGNGVAGLSGNGHPAVNAELNLPQAGYGSCRPGPDGSGANP
jgi:hypothetical protein